MSTPDPSSSASRLRRGVHRAPGLLIAVAILGVVGLCSSLASASTPPVKAAAATATAHTVTASAGTQTNVAPSGTLNDLVDGQTVSIHVEQASPANPIFGVDTVRQCKGGSTITEDADLLPNNSGKCLDAPLSATSNNVTGPAPKDPSATGVDITFKVGTGTRDVAYDDGAPHTSTITCDATHDCRLWIAIARTAGNDFVFYDLHFGPASGTTTTTTAATTTTTAAGGTTTTTAAGGTTTTTAAGGTTTTTAHGTTTTTAAGGTTTTAPAVTCPTTTTSSTVAGATTTTAAPTTTTTAAGGTTTTTAAGGTTTTTAAGGTTTTTAAATTTTAAGGATTTTLPSGTTVSPTGAAGGSLTVASTGWKPGTTVTGTLCSTPVTLGTLTADASGKITGAYAVPAATVAGSHELLLTGLDAASAKRTVTAGVTITAAAANAATTTTRSSSGGRGLAATGTNVLKLGLSGLLIAFAGWLFSVTAYRRRDRLGSGW